MYIVIWGSFWLILYSEWYRCRETELCVTVTVRLMDWTLVNNSLYLRWLLYLLCSLYSLIIFSIHVCIHIHYNSIENLHWQKLAETCFCRTGLNRFKPRFKPPSAETCQPCGHTVTTETGHFPGTLNMPTFINSTQHIIHVSTTHKHTSSIINTQRHSTMHTKVHHKITALVLAKH